MRLSASAIVFSAALFHALPWIQSFQVPHPHWSVRPVVSDTAVHMSASTLSDQNMDQVAEALDWSFIDAAYLITCPNADPGSERLNGATSILKQCNVGDQVQVKDFDTDDEDRIRGCYTSHISVLRDALKEVNGSSRSKNDQKNPFFFSTIQSDDAESTGSAIMVLEDNLALTGNLDQSILDEVEAFTKSNDSWDVIHLAYIPYVPNLVVSRTESERIVKVTCGVGSALGTTAYVISERGLKRLVEHDDREGYYAAIPDVMAELFPDTRYAAFPTPFLRAPQTKSLVNPQLDDLRALLFQPFVTTRVQSILALTGLNTNALLPMTIVLMLILTALSGTASVTAIWELATTGSYDGPLLLALTSLVFTAFSLFIIAQGILLAPPPPSTRTDVE